MNKIICLLKILPFFVVIINFGECSLKCYVCESKSDSHCLDPVKHNMVTRECLIEMEEVIKNTGLSYLATQQNFPFNCVNVVTKVNNEETITRGCTIALADEYNICKLLRDKRNDIIECSDCDKDGCNI
ncbi:hypothetical protein ILUMI_04149 [Ignelater luminosus]|uniref:Protein sleepless n=1 Tax=Ignelater luminosus TaxID=2038154 RepID=A0A8K0DKD4_IGNLU|nr:hypothetical protein ILUMI_04149 [Ignelater luminosus]